MITSVGEDVEKKELLYTIGGNVNWFSRYGKQYGIPQKIKNRSTYDTSGYIPKGNENKMSRRYMHSHVYHSIIHIQVYTHTHIYTVQYYAAMTKKEIMPFAATWTDLEDIMLSEVSQSEKDRYHMVLLICVI